MKRLFLTVGATVAGLSALLSFKTESTPVVSAGGLPSAALGTSGSSTPAAAPASSSGAASPSSAAPVARTLRGTAITTRYGIVQVQAVVAATTITDVSFVQLTAFDQHSQEINDQAGPILLKETLDAQSAQVDTVSGASYTSDGYRQSLQAALDQAGLK